MLKGNIIIYGKHSQKVNKLKELGIFERIIDVYFTASMVGLLYAKKGSKNTEIKDVTTTIFAETIQGEASRIKYFASLAYLVENNKMKGDEAKERELLKQTFGDWFGGGNDEDSQKKYNLLQEFALGGIDILYDKVIGNNTDLEAYYRNFYNFIKEVNELKIVDELDRNIAAALL